MKNNETLKKTNVSFIISGIPPGESGTGRLVSLLTDDIKLLSQRKIRLVFKPEKPAYWRIKLLFREKKIFKVFDLALHYFVRIFQFWLIIVRIWLNRDARIMLLHPQNLGYRLSIRLMESRRIPPVLYLLDSSFFCISSYNHVKRENRPCLRCIDYGFSQIKDNGCTPFPKMDWSATKFVSLLKKNVNLRKVRIVAQNIRQAELAQRHFVLSDPPQVIGLWTKDWNELFLEGSTFANTVMKEEYVWDVLFHGHGLEAKGLNWLVEVARYCPMLKFMFPVSKPVWIESTDNCIFLPCTWESGLREEISRSKFVAVPSLWSAPIEGSLVKSLVFANAVVVIDNKTSYCDELPEDIVLKLSEDPIKGASELLIAHKNGWAPDPHKREEWLKSFSSYKIKFIKSLIDCLG